jgi:hypothetical protein
MRVPFSVADPQDLNGFNTVQTLRDDWGTHDDHPHGKSWKIMENRLIHAAFSGVFQKTPSQKRWVTYLSEK